MRERDESPEAIAHALVQRIFELLHECRATLPKLAANLARPIRPASADPPLLEVRGGRTLAIHDPFER